MILTGALEARVVQDILDHEGCILWPYADSKGLVTIGVGHLLPTSGSMLALDLYVEPSMRPANLREKSEAWTAVKDGYERGRGALAYKGLSSVRLPREAAIDLFKGRLDNEFMPAISKAFPMLAAWPSDAIRAVVDIAYNCGAHCFERSWPNLVQACLDRNWVQAEIHCTRVDARRKPTEGDPDGLGPRNIWTIARFRAAHALDSKGPCLAAV